MRTLMFICQNVSFRKAKTKSAALKRAAKREGLPVVDITLQETDADDLRGLPKSERCKQIPGFSWKRLESEHCPRLCGLGALTILKP